MSDLHVQSLPRQYSAPLQLCSSTLPEGPQPLALLVQLNYTKSQFSILYDHVKDVAILADQSEGLLQTRQEVLFSKAPLLLTT